MLRSGFNNTHIADAITRARLLRTGGAVRLTPADFPCALRPILSFAKPLAPVTSFRIGGPAEVFAAPRNVHEAVALVAFANERSVPLTMLGAGSNLLVSDAGIAGIICSLREMRAIVPVLPGRGPAALPTVSTRVARVRMLRAARAEGEPIRVIAQAGASLEDLVKRTARLGLRGIEGLAGIPATVGGAVTMNAGTRHGDMAGAIERVLTVTPAGRLETLARDEIAFHYRRSSLMGSVVLQAVFALVPDNPAAVIDDRKQNLEKKLASQPWTEPSAGCVFKNLPAPGHAAGFMIDRAGCKGLTEGGAEVSSVHANFITNPSRAASARDVLRLIDRVRERVRKHFFVDLELELKLMGEAA